MAQSKRRGTAQPRNNLRTFYIVLAVVALGGIGWIAYSLAGGSQSAAVEPVQLTGLEDPQALLSTAKGVSLGEATAPVQVLVFSDFTCPACKGWSSTVEPQLKSEFVDAGQVRLVYYDFPLGGPTHVHGFLAARAARCAEEQGRFWEYHDVLFARQSEWAYTRTAPIDLLIEYAAALGLDRPQFEACLNSDRHAELVSANRMLGVNLGVGATPTIYVGGRSLPNWRIETVRAAVQRELGQ